MAEDDDDFVAAYQRAPAESDWFDRLGAGALALSACIATVLSVFALVAINQIGAAPVTEAAVPAAEEAVFEPPALKIARKPAPTGDGAWRRNAEPFDPGDAKGVIAVIVLEDGADPHAADRALDWSVPLTFAVVADFETSPHRIKRIRRAGREAMALIPMGYGPEFGHRPNVLERHLSDTEMLRRLHWHLARGGPVVGAMDLDGGDVLRDAHAAGILARGLSEKGMLFVDSSAVSDSIAGTRIRAQGVPTGFRTATIPAGSSIDDAFAVMAEAQAHALDWGTAIVLVHADSDALGGLAMWLRSRDSTVAIAPVSHVVGNLRRGGL